MYANLSRSTLLHCKRHISSINIAMERALLIERSIVELDVVAPHAPEAGQDLREGGHDEVLAVPKSRMGALISSIRSISVNLRLGSSSPLPFSSPPTK